jgi:hypothetical protein
MHYHITDGDSPLREANGLAEEIVRAVRISLCGLDLGRPASFVPESPATADFDWQSWLSGPFSEVLGEAFVAIFLAAGQLQVRELVEIDRKLTGERSRDAGSSLLVRLAEAKNLRVVERLRSILGDARPHFTTAFAVECAEFHLPLRSALVSYLYGEWRCGMSVLDERGDLDVFAAAGGKLISGVVADVLSRGAGPFDYAAGL